MTKKLSVAAIFLGGLLCSASALAQNSQIQPSIAADFEVRIQRLERSLSEVTGRYEEALHQITQLRERLEAVNSDADFRLKELESGSAGSGSAMAPAEAPARPATGSARAPDPAPSPAPAKPSQVAAAPPAAAPAAGGTPDKQYEAAYELLQTNQYDKAEKAFAAFVAKNKTHRLAGNAQYWLGETYYVRNKFAEAAGAFAEGVSTYSKNAKAPDNLLKFGMSLQRLNQKKDACTAFGQLAVKFPQAAASVKRRAETESRKLGC